MKYFFIKSVFLLLCIGNLNAQYSTPYNNFYVAMGTSVSSYVGGYFGNAYQLRVLSDYYDDYYSGYSSYNYYDDYSSYDSYYTLWSPIQFDFAMGYEFHENISFELGGSLIYHMNGRVDPEFISGSNSNDNYMDRNSYSQLFALPLSATIKFHSPISDGNGVFVKGGPAFQYTSEKYDRVREYYSYNNFNSYSSYAYLRTVSKTSWLPGFTASIGAQFSLSEGISNFTEVQYSYFKINGDGSTALALDRAKEAHLLSLSTKVYFSF